MTFSIVALDSDSGEIGVAVQTSWPGVGSVVPWVEPGVGGVATQAFTNVDLGPMALVRLRDGYAAPDVLERLLLGDPGRETRQLGMVDAAGRSAVHTGSRCVAQAGHATAPGVSVQVNMLERADVPPLMLDAFRDATGDLADRLLAALSPGQRTGGDVRGSQSAALLVAPGSPGAEPWARRFDLRVDESAQPIEELARLLQVARAYESLEAALAAIETGKLEVALDGTTAAHQLVPDDAQIAFWHAIVLFASGQPDEAQPVLDAALRSEPRLAEFGHRFAEAGHGVLIASALRGVRRPRAS